MNCETEIEALLLRLDTVSELTMESSSAVAAIDTPSTLTEQLRATYARLDKHAREIAMKTRDAESKLGKDHADVLKQRAELHKSVQQALQTRQQLHRVELAEFQKRVKRLQQSIDLRDKIADKIVDRRVEELLDPNTDWDSAEYPDYKTRHNQFDDGVAVAVPLDSPVEFSPEVFTKPCAVGHYVTGAIFESTPPAGGSAASLSAFSADIGNRASELMQIIVTHTNPKAASFDSAGLQLLVQHTKEGHEAVEELFRSLQIPTQTTVELAQYETNGLSFDDGPLSEAIEQISDAAENSGWISTPSQPLIDLFKRAYQEASKEHNPRQPQILRLRPGQPHQIKISSPGELVIVTVTARIDPATQLPQVRRDLWTQGSNFTTITTLDGIAVVIPAGEGLVFLVHEPDETVVPASPK